MRFIDYSSDGGCSQKAAAGDLMQLCEATNAIFQGGVNTGLNDDFKDVGRYKLGSVNTLSSVDIIFPMIDDPGLFGTIAANHAMNDIYASFGSPKFGLTILGVPKRLDVYSGAIVQMLAVAAKAFENDGAILIGGHTLANQENLYLGFSVVGVESNGSDRVRRQPKAGDGIILTKPLGTSVASFNWKVNGAYISDHDDVVAGMCRSNRVASEIAATYHSYDATDVSGFGFINNLAMLLKRVKCGAVIYGDALPVYPSVVGCVDFADWGTRQFYHNVNFANDLGFDTSKVPHNLMVPTFDAQTAAGLIVITPADFCEAALNAMKAEKIPAIKIGVVQMADGLHMV